jgi:hypothetical protein
MNAFCTMKLFSEPTQSGQTSYSLALSLLFHCGAAGVLISGLVSNPQIREPHVERRYTVRLMELQRLNPKWPRLESVDYPAPLSVPSKSSSAPKHLTPPSTPYRTVGQAAASSTLLQPDVPPKLVLPKEVSLPSIIMRSEDSTAHLIVPPPRQEQRIADVRPSIDLPNNEVNLADIKIASTATGNDTLKLRSSNTSPVVDQVPEPTNKLPETASVSARQPTPLTVISLSDLRMVEGTVPLPLANQLGSAAGSHGLSRKGGGADHGHATGSSGYDSGTAPSTKRIMPPKNGKFGMVVVGASLQEDYPEIASVWNGRLAYTVYLHVGQAKNWILQYSPPLAAEVTGTAAHLEAPWPTDMLIPNLSASSVNSDAVLAHGLLNQQGRFENLTIVFPPQLTVAKFILETLGQWQFRPAEQSGRAVPVEVLLIIPEMPE